MHCRATEAHAISYADPDMEHTLPGSLIANILLKFVEGFIIVEMCPFVAPQRPFMPICQTYSQSLLLLISDRDRVPLPWQEWS